MKKFVDHISPEGKDRIIEAAVLLCKWVSWFDILEVSGRLRVRDLKKLIEKESGLEIEEYT